MTHIQKISKFDTANGKGIRTTIWMSGCSHKCPGCHNPQTWNPLSGRLITDNDIDDILDSISPEYINGITLSGGDPLHPHNRYTTSLICSIVKDRYPNKTIWLYTGFNWEDICQLSLLSYVDVLVDGRYDESLRDISLPYCGSSNQRVIDVQKSLIDVDIVLYDDDL